MRLDNLRTDGKNGQSVDEALKDYVKLVGNALAGVVSARHRGQAEVQALTLDNKRVFLRYMGRQSMTFETLTWNIIFKYLTLETGLNLSEQEAMMIFRDTATKAKVEKLWISQKSGAAGGTLASPQASRNWGQKGALVGGTEDPDGAKRAEIALTYILELASIKRLEKEVGGKDMPEPEKASEPQQAKPESSQKSEPQLDQTTIDNIKQGLADLKGKTS